jgi:biopolymer transport protein ExbB
MPIDVSGGLAIAKRELTRTFAEYLSAGGVVMIPLLIVAILGILIIIERLITLSLIHSKTKDLTQKVSELCNEGRFQDAEKLCAQGSNPIARILRAGLSHREASKEIMEDMLREAILHELPRIERFLSTLGVLAMIAPFLGLLGTVTGMITTFNVITVHGTGDPGLLSGGISEALITTQAGLIIAIPILLLHAYISGKVNHVINDIEANATRLVNIMVEKG